ncbi:MAG TPA: DUF4214 domain-containing protein, partial [Gemmataceae bacterium]|nr:DUF4214 domain-containing protein [Gemmataceae bacterium]
NVGGTMTASLTTSSLSAGNHTITASYGGDSNSLPSTGGMGETISTSIVVLGNSLASTTTVLAASSLAVPVGQPVLLMATVSSNLTGWGMSGSVAFLDHGTLLATVPLNGLMATYTASTLSVGSHTLTASYSGDSNHSAGTSRAVTVSVGSVEQRFVSQVYQSILQRPPDPGGLDTWTAALQQGASRAQVALAVQQSQEARIDQVQGLYQQYLHRHADPSGLQSFVSFLHNGGTLEQVSSILTSSPEYLQSRGGGTASGFVTALYQDAFQRSPSVSEVAVHTQALAAGASPQQVANGILASTENAQYTIARSYQEFLRRPADSSGLNTYVKAMRAGQLDQDHLTSAMLSSDEFLAHV